MIYRNTYPTENYAKPVKVKETANQYVKRMIVSKLQSTREFLYESVDQDQDSLTEKEREAIYEAFEKKYQAIRKYLNA